MIKKRFSFLQVPVDSLSLKDVLDKIKLYLSSPPQFRHIVSINPENIVIAQKNGQFRSVCQNADLALTDGIGVILGARLLGISIPERVPGSVLLPHLLDLAGAMSLTVVLIGSQANLADSIAKCYSRSYPEAIFIGLQGYKNSEQPTKEEEENITTIVRSTRPHFVFVAFGSPAQEVWIDTHKKLLEGVISMGVGGAFDYLSGATQEPPRIVRALGLEWLYRLITQPWRIERQAKRLPIFIGMVLKEYIGMYNAPTHEKTSHRSS